MAKTKA